MFLKRKIRGHTSFKLRTSFSVELTHRKKFSKELEQDESRDLTQDDTKDHLYGGGSCGLETNDLVVNNQRVEKDGTHRDTRNVESAILAQTIRNAILVIVSRSSNHNPRTRDHGLGVVGHLSIELKLGKRSNALNKQVEKADYY